MEPTLKTRREFLRTTTLSTAFTWTVPAFLARTFNQLQAQAAARATQAVSGKDNRILVVLQMAGGNDGLNTVVPFDNDYYRRARPRLGLARDAVLKVNDEIGFHPGLKGFQALHGDGKLAVIHGVGYPNPNRSHFRSTEIWQTATDANKVEKYGWIGRYFDHSCKGADPTVGVNIGRQTPQAFSARKPKGISLENPDSYRLNEMDDTVEADDQSLRRMNRPAEDTATGGSIAALSGKLESDLSVLDYLERTALDAQLSSDKVRELSSKVPNRATYPGGQLANALKLTARLIGGGLPTRIYYVSQGGYDTHSNQAGTQTRLLTELGGSLKAFVDDLKAQGNFERVLVVTFSEFGRRVGENASGGTDHGAAAPLFVVGDKVKAGFIGTQPSLAPGDLVNGDLKFNCDFRRIYAGVLEQWLGTPSEPILGRKFEPVPFVG